MNAVGHQFKYRIKCQIVAVADLVLTSVSLLIGPYLMSVASDDSEYSLFGFKRRLEHEYDEPVKKEANLIFILWLFICFILLWTVVQLVAAFKLLYASQKGQDPSQALKYCIFYRKVAIIFLLLYVVFGIPFTCHTKWDSFTSTLITVKQLIFRMISICLVTQFMSELEETIDGEDSNGTVSIITGNCTTNMRGPPPPYESLEEAMPPSYEEIVDVPHNVALLRSEIRDF